MVERAKNALELKLDAAATPERVAAAAQLLARMLAAVAPSLPDGSVTMIVENYATRAVLRTRSREAERSVKRVIDVLANPVKAARREKKTIEIATAVADEGRPLQPFRPQFFKPRRKTPIAVVTEPFLRQMRDIADEYREKTIVRGSTVIYSRVYRVGSTGEGQKIRARIDTGGDRPVDLDVAPSVAERFFDAAKAQRVLPIRVEGAWHRLGNAFSFDPGQSVVTDVNLEWRSISGAELVDGAERDAPGAFEDIEDILADIEGS